MAAEPLRPKGWLADRLRPLGWSVLELSVMLGEHYKQAMRWNSGRYEPPPQVMEWIGRFERWFAANPPPKRDDYVMARSQPVGDRPPPFVQRVIDAMEPGETASVDDLIQRLGASRKSVLNRLSAAGVSGRLGPLRRVPAGVYRAVGDEVPPGGSLEFPPVVEKGVTAFVGQILDAMKPGETLSFAEVAARMGVRADVVGKQLAKAAESDRLGPVERVGDEAIRRSDEDDTEEVSTQVEPKNAPPKPRAVKPAPEKPMTTDRARELLAELDWSQRSIARLLQWPDTREPRRWFDGKEIMPPEVAVWLEGVVAAKASALKNAAPGEASESMVSAAVFAAMGDPKKVRDAVFASRREKPRPERTKKDAMS